MTPVAFRIGAAVLAAALLGGCGVSVDQPVPSGPGSPPPATDSPTAAAAPSVRPLDLTVMSYNTLTGKNDCAGCDALRKAGLGDELALAVRMPAAAAKIAAVDPDIVGFQENEGPTPLPATYLARELPGYTWVLAKRTVPIAVRAARFEVLDSGLFVLEARPIRCTARDRTTGRFVAWARLRERAGGRTLWVFNTHLHPYDTKACAALRGANLRKLSGLIADKNPGTAEPMVVTGDFNDDRVNLRGAGLGDTRSLARRDDSDVPGADSAGRFTATVKGRTHVKVVRRTGRVIDYVWVGGKATVAGWQVLSGPGVKYRVIDGVRTPYWPGVVPSDHSPVVARISLR